MTDGDDVAETERRAVMCLLRMMGDDPTREGLQETPERVRKALAFFGSGYNVAPNDVLKCFEDGAEGCDEMVFQGSIPLWSMCEHHILPFWGVAHIGYLPKKRIVGLSKLSRLVDVFARRLQVQERLTVQVAEALMTGLAPHGCGVVLQCRHTCIEARGVQKAGSVTMTTALRGNFLEPNVKSEFLANVRLAASKEQW
jgi:GTP cyclohydrolase I